MALLAQTNAPTPERCQSRFLVVPRAVGQHSLPAALATKRVTAVPAVVAPIYEGEDSAALEALVVVGEGRRIDQKRIPHVRIYHKFAHNVSAGGQSRR